MRISNTQINMYTQCPKKYNLWYKKGWRSIFGRGALIFGTAIDRALNHLLQTKDLQAAIEVFNKEILTQEINRVATYLPKATNVVYAANDFDYELLGPEDIELYKQTRVEFGMSAEDTIENDVKYILEQKKKVGFAALEEVEKRLYNLAHWMSLRAKGRVLIRSYNKEILPTIKNVLCVQKQGLLPNDAGDEIIMYLDMILEYHDGSRYLMDNKTSTRDYEEDAPMKSQQLILYYHAEKDEYKLDGVGFNVLYKQIVKNRVKTCSVCNFDGTGGRHKTCSNEIDGKRCNAPWIESISPEGRIQVIRNVVPEAAESLVMETCDSALEGIKKESFGPNLNACGSGEWTCNFYKHCWKQNDEEIVKPNE